jgi:hypothetical protein
MDSGIKQRVNDVFFNCLGRIVTHGAAMMDAIHYAHGRFGFGGFLGIAHILILLRSDLCG